MKTTTLQHKAFSTDVKISPDEQRTVVVRASTAAIDREGEVLIPQGCNSKEWEKNPIIALNHSYWNLPVGKGVSLRRDEDAVVIKFQFAERPPTFPADEEWLPDTLFSLFQQGVLNAVSVGFIPIEGRAANTRDLNKFGEDCKYIHSKWQLLELSVVPLPCNPEAVSVAVGKGFVSQSTADKLFKAMDDDKPETAPCKTCGKDFPIEDMTDVDGGYVCTDCGMDDDEDDVEEKTAEPVEEVAKSVTPPPVKRLFFTVDYSADVSETVSASVDVKAVAQQAVSDAVAKARGVIFLV